MWVGGNPIHIYFQDKSVDREGREKVEMKIRSKFDFMDNQVDGMWVRPAIPVEGCTSSGGK